MNFANSCFYIFLFLIITACTTTQEYDPKGDYSYLPKSIRKLQNENSESHEEQTDYLLRRVSETNIILDDAGITVTDSPLCTVSGSVVTIHKAGVYRITGSLSDGQLVVDTEDEDNVTLILGGISISSSISAPINILSAEKVLINLIDGTSNTLIDSDCNDKKATLYCKSDLTIYGTGILNIRGNCNDGIKCNDGLLIKNGTFNITAEDDGITGKDYLIITDGRFDISCGGDALSAFNEENTSLGYVLLEEGHYKLAAASDGIQAETDLMIRGGNFDIITAGGYLLSQDDRLNSAKGLKAGLNLFCEGGVFNLNTADDALHSDGSLLICDGSFDIKSANDAIHAENILKINGGIINITSSYEGIEGHIIVIDGGSIDISCSDDGINASLILYERQYLYINGGIIEINTLAGDGLDSNGVVFMTGGSILINGSTSWNIPLDYAEFFDISGGTIIAVGFINNMAKAPSSSSSQVSLFCEFDNIIAAGSIVSLKDESGHELFSFVPEKECECLIYSDKHLRAGKSYSFYIDGIFHKSYMIPQVYS